MPKSLSEDFTDLSTPLVADSLLRLKLPLRVAPINLKPISPGFKLAGRVLPAKHFGSVDVFLEAMKNAKSGDVLVIDNAGRGDEACIGDLTVLEARANGLGGMVVNGLHRDTEQLLKIGFPVFSRGASPSGPRRLDQRTPDALASADFGDFTVSNSDLVFGDDDGVLFVRDEDANSALREARAIFDTERRQADSIRSGTKLSNQLHFDSYLERRRTDPSYTFRRHLRKIGGAVEE